MTIACFCQSGKITYTETVKGETVVHEWDHALCGGTGRVHVPDQETEERDAP